MKLDNKAKYYARLCDIAKKCEFNDEDDAIRAHLIKTMNTNRIRVKTIRNNWTLSQILDEAAVEEESTAQAHEIHKKLHDAMEFQKIKQITKDKRDRSATCYRCGCARLTELNASNAVNGTTTPKCAGVQIAKTVQRRKEKNPVTKTTRKKILRMDHDTQDRRRLINTAIDEFDTYNEKIPKRDQ